MAETSVLFENVLKLLASLLKVALSLIALALGLQVLIPGRVTGSFLTLTAELLRGVTDLVIKSHDVSSYGRLQWSCDRL